MSKKSRAMAFLEDNAIPTQPHEMPREFVQQTQDPIEDEGFESIGLALDAALSTLFGCVSDLEERMNKLEKDHETITSEIKAITDQEL